MDMVSDRFDVVVNVRAKMISCLSDVPASLDHMIQMRYDAGSDEGVPVLIKIDPPGVAGSPAKHFKLMGLGMKPPYTCVDRNSILIGSSRLTDPRMRKHTLYPVEPAIRTPYKTV